MPIHSSYTGSCSLFETVQTGVIGDSSGRI